MAVMMEKLYDALLAAKVPDDKARAAAVEIAAFEKPLLDFSQFAAKADLSAIRAEMATKADLAALRAEMATKADLSAIRAEMATKAELATARAEISAEIAAVRAEIVEAKNEVLKWVFGLILGSTAVNIGTVIATVKLLVPGH
jgi:hypothetical protein